MLGGSGKTATIRNSGFKGARDKVVQHNGNGSTVTIDNIYVETAGKLYRSCGEGSGCGSASAVRTVNASNIYAIGVGQVLGVSSNDKATLKNICAYRTPQVCHVYQPGSDTDAPVGANSVGEGPSANCVYTAADTHALVNRVNGAVTTDVLCTGPNSAKTGSTATACVSGFNTCLKGCAPGSYGFKQLTCSGGKYAEAAAGLRPARRRHRRLQARQHQQQHGDVDRHRQRRLHQPVGLGQGQRRQVLRLRDEARLLPGLERLVRLGLPDAVVVAAAR